MSTPSKYKMAPFPIPVSITVRNLFPPLVISSNSQTSPRDASHENNQDNHLDDDQDNEQDNNHDNNHDNEHDNEHDNNKESEQEELKALENDNSQEPEENESISEKVPKCPPNEGDSSVCLGEEGSEEGPEEGSEGVSDEESSTSKSSKRSFSESQTSAFAFGRAYGWFSLEDRYALLAGQVLRNVRLDIVLKNRRTTNYSKEDSKEDSKNIAVDCNGNGLETDQYDKNDEILIYSSHSGPHGILHDNSHNTALFTPQSPSAHPRWDFLDERIPFFHSSHSNWEHDYHSLWAKFVIIDPPNKQSTLAPLNNNAPLHHPPSSNANANANNIPQQQLLLAEVPLHPAELRRLPNPPHDSLDNNNNSNFQYHRNSYIIPSSLPPNSILLHYDDGSTRVLPSLYWLLVHEGIISEMDITQTVVRRTSAELDGSETRFSEDVFHVLEDSLPKNQDINDDNDKNQNTNKISKENEYESKIDNEINDVVAVVHTSSTSSIFGDDSVFDLLGNPTKTTTSNSKTPIKLSSSHHNTNSIFEDNVFDLVGKTTSQDNISQTPLPLSSTTTNNVSITHVDDGYPSKESELTNNLPHVSTEPLPSSSSSSLTPTPLPQPQTISLPHGAPLPESPSSVWRAPSSPIPVTTSPLPTIPPVTPPTSRTLVPSTTPTTATTPTTIPTQSPPLPPPPSKEEIHATNLLNAREKVMHLQQLIRQEQILLEKERQFVQSESDQLKALVLQVNTLQQEALDIKKDAVTERVNLLRYNIRLETRRIHLLKHLQKVFPIHQIHHHQYTIAGIPLPDDIHNPSITDEQVSIALGFVCHLVSLTSKYLQIPLRYSLQCKFSRSVIVDYHCIQQQPPSSSLSSSSFSSSSGNKRNANTAIHPTFPTTAAYPLFRERGVVERELLDQGMVLLRRDVECLLKMRGVEYYEEWSILGKMDRLLGQLTEGDDSFLVTL